MSEIDELLQQCRDLDKEASPGPWGHTYDGSSMWSVGQEPDPQVGWVAHVGSKMTGPDEGANARFIARARTLLPALVEAVEQQKAAKDGAYSERNKVVAAFAKLALALGFRAGVGYHPLTDTAWEADWRTIVFIDLPTGQVSWHFHDSEKPLLAGLPAYAEAWDGHTTPQKYARLEALSVHELRAQLTEAQRERDQARAEAAVMWEALGDASDALGDLRKTVHDFDQEGAHDEWRFSHVEGAVSKTRTLIERALTPGPAAALLEEVRGLRAFAESFAVTAEGAVRHHETKDSGGQKVAYLDDFANAPPSVVGQLRRWAKQARAALEGGRAE